MSRIPMKLKQWVVPNYVRMEMPVRSREEGVQELPAIHVRDVPAETLAELCDDFRRAVFEKAGKADPEAKGGAS